MHILLYLACLVVPLAEPPAEMVNGVRVLRGEVDPAQGSLLRAASADPTDLLLFGAKVYGHDFVMLGTPPATPTSLELRHLTGSGFDHLVKGLGMQVTMHPGPPPGKTARKPRKKKARAGKRAKYPKMPLALLTAPGSSVEWWKDAGPDKKSPRISLTLRGVSLRQLMAHISKVSGTPHMVHKDVSAKITLHLEDVPALVVAEAVVRASGFMRQCVGKGKGAVCVVGPLGMEPVSFRASRDLSAAAPARVKGLKMKVGLVLDGVTTTQLATLLAGAFGKKSRLFGAGGGALTLTTVPSGKQSLAAQLEGLATANDLVIVNRPDGMAFGTKEQSLAQRPDPPAATQAAETKPIAIMTLKKKAWVLADNGKVLTRKDQFAGCPIAAINQFQVIAKCGEEDKTWSIAPATEPPGAATGQPPAVTSGRALKATFIDFTRRLGLVAHPGGPSIYVQGEKTPAGELIDWIDSKSIELWKDGQRTELTF